MRTKKILYLLPAFLMFASCHTDDNETENIHRKYIVAGWENNDKSGRTSFVEEEDGTMQGVFWTPGDQIGVFSANGNENACFSTNIQTAVATTTFSGDLAGAPKYAYFPYSSGNTSVKSISGNLLQTQHYSSIKKLLCCDYKYGVPKAGEGTTYRFLFTHFFPMIRFEVDAERSAVSGEQLESVTLVWPEELKFHTGKFTADATTGAVTWDNTAVLSNRLTMTWSDKPELKARAKVHGYLFVDAINNLEGHILQILLKTSSRVIKFRSQLLLNEFKPNYVYNVPLILKGWENQFENPSPDEDGLHFGGGSADNSEILSVKLDVE